MKLEAKALCFSYDMSGMNEIGFPGNESKRTKRNRTTREILSRFDLTLESGELVGAAAPVSYTHLVDLLLRNLQSVPHKIQMIDVAKPDPRNISLLRNSCLLYTSRCV